MSNQSATAVRSEHVAETIVAVPMVALVPSAASALPVAVSVAAVRRTGAGAPDTSHNSKLYPTGRVAEPESPVQTRLFMTLVAYKTVNCVASSRPGLRWLASRRLNRPANRQNHFDFVSSRIVYRRCSRSGFIHIAAPRSRGVRVTNQPSGARGSTTPATPPYNYPRLPSKRRRAAATRLTRKLASAAQEHTVPRRASKRDQDPTQRIVGLESKSISS